MEDRLATLSPTTANDAPHTTAEEPTGNCNSPTPSLCENRSLRRTEIWNLLWLLLAWACVVSNITMVVGTGAVAMISIGASSATSLPLAAFFFGAAVSSCALTWWIFGKQGWKRGFVVGIMVGLMGTVLGCCSIWLSSPALLAASSFLFGMATGVGFVIRFVAVEVVPSHWVARAVTLVVSGGCLAAFVGPESARASQNMFRKDDGEGGNEVEFLGVFVVTGIFNLLNLICTLLVQFPDVARRESSRRKKDKGKVVKEKEDDSGDDEVKKECRTSLSQLLLSRQFLVPMLIAGLSWAIMAMPMSIFRVIMHQVGYTPRQSLTTIELHFLGMYMPGFLTGPLIQKFGTRRICASGAAILFGSVVCLLYAPPKDEASGIVLWIVGMILVGVGWNLGFTSATVWLTGLYRQSPNRKQHIQAANDAAMYVMAGSWSVSASYVSIAGGGELDGWELLNKVVLGLLGVYILIMVVDLILESRSGGNGSPEKNGTDLEAIENSQPN